MTFPEDLLYTKDHEWLRRDGNIGIVGITDYAQGELGDVIYLDVQSGKDVKPGDTFGTVEAVKTVSDLYAPVAGKILEANSALNDAPETVNKDPYGDGWLVKMELAGEPEGLLTADEYKALIGQ